MQLSLHPFHCFHQYFDSCHRFEQTTKQAACVRAIPVQEISRWDGTGLSRPVPSQKIVTTKIIGYGCAIRSCDYLFTQSDYPLNKTKIWSHNVLQLRGLLVASSAVLKCAEFLWCGKDVINTIKSCLFHIVHRSKLQYWHYFIVQIWLYRHSNSAAHKDSPW